MIAAGIQDQRERTERVKYLVPNLKDLEGHDQIKLDPAISQILGFQNLWTVQMDSERVKWESKKPINASGGMEPFLTFKEDKFEPTDPHELGIVTNLLRRVIQKSGLLGLHRALNIVYHQKAKHLESLDEALIHELLSHNLITESVQKWLQKADTPQKREYLENCSELIKDEDLTLAVLSPNGLIHGILLLIDLNLRQNQPSPHVAELAFELAGLGLLVGHNFKNASKIDHHAQVCTLLDPIEYRFDLNQETVFPCPTQTHVEQVFALANQMQNVGIPVSLCYLNQPRFGGKAMAIFAHDIYAGKHDDLITDIPYQSAENSENLIEQTALEIAHVVGVAALETPINIAVIKTPRFQSLFNQWSNEFAYEPNPAKYYDKLQILWNLFNLKPVITLPNYTQFKTKTSAEIKEVYDLIITKLQQNPYLFTQYCHQTTTPIKPSEN